MCKKKVKSIRTHIHIWGIQNLTIINILMKIPLLIS